MNTIGILKQARALIEQGWCQGTYARDAHGFACFTHDPRAVCFCLSGALRRAGGGELPFDMHAQLGAYSRVTSIVPNLAVYNDDPSRTKEEVLAVFDKAIAGVV